jgi:catechol 2,3-dioxygenase-like lactoylglutathione lyase family enzyme
MPRHHHVNLSVPSGGLPDQQAFLIDVIGYRKLDAPDQLVADGINVNWFEGDDGSQIHLSEDRDHRAAAMAHVAVEFDAEELAAVEKRLEAAAIEYKVGERPGFPRIVFLCDPAGNRWELRGPG